MRALLYLPTWEISEGTDQISESANVNEKLRKNTSSGITSFQPTVEQGPLRRSTPKVNCRCIYKSI